MNMKNYQKRIIHPQSKDPFSDLSEILENLREYLNNTSFSLSCFKQKVEKELSSSDEMTQHFKRRLLKCSNKSEALETIQDLYCTVTPIAANVEKWSKISNVVRERLKDIEKGFY